MVRRLLLLIVATFLIVATLTVFSCSKSECAGAGCSDVTTADSQVGITLMDASCTTGYLPGSTLKEELNCLSILIKSASGSKVFSESFKKGALDAQLTVKGIPDATNTEVSFHGFADATCSQEKWTGVVHGMTFKKGKTTNVSVVMYPAYDFNKNAGSQVLRGCFPTGLQTPRFGQAMTELPDGRILVTGGFAQKNGDVWGAVASVEIIDPETGTVEQLQNMGEERAFHIAVALPNGKVIITGGVKEMSVAKFAVDGYPDLPFTIKSRSNGVDVYTPSYPSANKKANAIGVTVANTNDYTIDNGANDIFFPYQSYAYVADDVTTGSGTIYMVGGVKDGQALNNIYGVEIAVGQDGSVSIAGNEYHAGDKEPYVMPVLAATGDDRVLILGGKKKGVTPTAQLLSRTELSAWSGPVAPNLSFGSAVSAGTSIIAAGGLENSSDGGFVVNGGTYRFSIADSQLSSGSLFYGTFLQEIVYSSSRGLFASLAGTTTVDMTGSSTVDGNDVIQLVDTASMNFSTNSEWYQLSAKRVMHRALRTLDGRVFIVGGMGDLKNSSTPVSGIEMFAF